MIRMNDFLSDSRPEQNVFRKAFKPEGNENIQSSSGELLQAQFKLALEWVNYHEKAILGTCDCGYINSSSIVV